VSKTVAIVNGSGSLDGITFGSRPYLEALRALGHDTTWYQCVDFATEPFLPPGAHEIRGLGIPLHSLDMGINRIWVFPRRLRRIQEALVFLSDPTLINAVPARCSTIVKVHDLRPLTPYRDRLLTLVMFKYVLPKLRAAERIIVTTRAMAEELVAQGVHSDAIHLVPDSHTLGSHPEHLTKSSDRIDRTKEIKVLCVSSDRPYKNLEQVIRLATKLERDPTLPRFRFTLLTSLRRRTRMSLAMRSLSNLEVVSRVPSIADVYESHDVLITPSVYEGFGRPLIEAMAFGMPIVARNIPTIAEVAGGAALLVDGVDEGEWIAVLSSLRDPAVYSHWARAAFSRSRAFGPETFRGAVAAAFNGL